MSALLNVVVFISDLRELGVLRMPLMLQLYSISKKKGVKRGSNSRPDVVQYQ
jgi:hypothetical protein